MMSQCVHNQQVQFQQIQVQQLQQQQQQQLSQSPSKCVNFTNSQSSTSVPAVAGQQQKRLRFNLSATTEIH